jgi:hypothetical protein
MLELQKEVEASPGPPSAWSSVSEEAPRSDRELRILPDRRMDSIMRIPHLTSPQSSALATLDGDLITSPLKC